MLFNSYIFIFGFLPAALAGFYLLGHQRRDWAIWVWSKLACARSLSPPRLASVGSHTAPPAFFGRCFMEW